MRGECVETYLASHAEGRWWSVDTVLQNVKKGSETRQSRIVLRDLVTGSKKEVRAKSGEKVDTVEILPVDCILVSREGKRFTAKVRAGVAMQRRVVSDRSAAHRGSGRGQRRYRR